MFPSATATAPPSKLLDSLPPITPPAGPDASAPQRALLQRLAERAVVLAEQAADRAERAHHDGAQTESPNPHAATFASLARTAATLLALDHRLAAPPRPSRAAPGGDRAPEPRAIAATPAPSPANAGPRPPSPGNPLAEIDRAVRTLESDGLAAGDDEHEDDDEGGWVEPDLHDPNLTPEDRAWLSKPPLDLSAPETRAGIDGLRRHYYAMIDNGSADPAVRAAQRDVFETVLTAELQDRPRTVQDVAMRLTWAHIEGRLFEPAPIPRLSRSPP